MESLLRGELVFGGGSDALGEEVCEMRWPVSVDINRFAAAYHEIRIRLAALEKENSSIRRRLRTYEMKFPTITRLEEGGGGGGVCCRCDSDEVDLIQTENTNLQQQIDTLVQELQDSKAHEQRLEEVIKAYEKIHLEKSSVQKELDKMTTLAEQHVEKIRALETALGRRENLLQKKSSAHYLHLHASLDAPYAPDAPGLQSSRSLDALTDLKVQRLEAELQGAWCEVRRACQREAGLKAELQRLQEEIREEKQRQLQEECEAECEHCSVEWIQKAGDEQVDLALAYTELMEELHQIRTLTTQQNHILLQNHSPVELTSPVSRHGPASPPSDPAPPHPMRSQFQGRRSYSDMADPSFSPRTISTPVSTLPKRRSSGRAHLRPAPVGPRPSSAHGALQLSYQLPDSTPGPLATPPQSSEDEEEDEEWVELRVMTPPHHLHAADEYAQSWPSIKLWMELEESEFRSCPLCQLLFPTGFPDDALITHIDTHLENSKI